MSNNDFNIKITGNWEFDNGKSIPENNETKKAIKELGNSFSGTGDNDDMLKAFQDGKITQDEAELIMMQFETNGITGLDDFNIEDEEIRQFLTKRGVDEGKLEEATQNMQTVLTNIVNTYKEGNKTTSVNENYKAVTDIYTTDAKTTTLAPKEDSASQSVVFDKDKTGPQKTTVEDLIKNAFDFETVFDVKNFPQFYEQDEEGNLVYRDENGKVTEDKKTGSPTFQFETIEDTYAHNIIDEYLQNNKALEARLVEAYNEGKTGGEQITSLDDLSNKYDAIKDLNLIKVPENGKEPEALDIVVPEVKLPTPGGSSRIADTKVEQAQFSTENKSVEILTQEEYDAALSAAVQKFNTELGGVPKEFADKLPDNIKENVTVLEDKDAIENFEAKLDEAMSGKHTSVQNAIASEYGLELDSKGNIKDKDAFNAILFQVANDPANADLFEYWTDNDGELEANSLNDNERAQVLLNQLTADDIEKLNLPDNVLVNSIKYENGKYNYTTGKEILQLSVMSPENGEALSEIPLAETIDPENPDKNAVTKLDDILKYSYDPRTGEALKGDKEVTVKSGDGLYALINKNYPDLKQGSEEWDAKVTEIMNANPEIYGTVNAEGILEGARSENADANSRADIMLHPGDTLQMPNSFNINDQASQALADAYMLNNVKDNPEIFAATQEINGKLELFGAYEIDEKALAEAAKANGEEYVSINDSIES